MILFATLVLALAGGASAGNSWSIDGHVIAGGGTMEAESSDGQWQLAGTIGQWESSEARALSGGDWDLTGGFWALTLDELMEQIFSDRFEDDN